MASSRLDDTIWETEMVLALSHICCGPEGKTYFEITSGHEDRQDERLPAKLHRHLGLAKRYSVNTLGKPLSDQSFFPITPYPSKPEGLEEWKSALDGEISINGTAIKTMEALYNGGGLSDSNVEIPLSMTMRVTPKRFLQGEAPDSDGTETLGSGMATPETGRSTPVFHTRLANSGKAGVKMTVATGYDMEKSQLVYTIKDVKQGSAPLHKNEKVAQQLKSLLTGQSVTIVPEWDHDKLTGNYALELGPNAFDDYQSSANPFRVDGCSPREYNFAIHKNEESQWPGQVSEQDAMVDSVVSFRKLDYNTRTNCSQYVEPYSEYCM